MADSIPNYAPNFQIPTNAFVRQADPYGQILPNALAGYQAADALRKKRALASVFQGLGQQPLFSQDPIAQSILPIMQANPEIGIQLLPTLMSGAYKSRNRAGAQATRTIYQNPKSGDVSGIEKPGWTPVTLPEQQATIRLQTQGEANRRSGRFNDIMGLNVGKAANMIDINQGSLVDETSQLRHMLNDLQVKHVQLYQKYGGALKGKASGFMSDLTGGTSSYQTPFGEIGIPGASPDVKGYNDAVNGTIQQLAFFLKEKGKLSDNDAKTRLEPLKASLQKNPAALSRTYDQLREILDAYESNDINRMNRAYARLGIKSRMKPNQENAKLMMQKQMLAQMAAGGAPSMEALNPGDLPGLSDDQLQMLNQEED